MVRLIFSMAVLAALVLSGPSVRAGTPQAIDDPAKFAQEISDLIAKSQTEEAASQVAAIVGVPEQTAMLSGLVSTFKGHPLGVEDKVIDKTFGTSLHQIIYMFSFDQASFVYVRYNFKKTGIGWILANFNYQTETQGLFPPSFVESY
ncbi:hypothetical protein [Aestuariivirga sp.]|uniref:hypothetical protein n=1 Tax=Aestuariivirga sp. TaxID=2650926 RepID=UPI0039E57EE8